MRNFRWGILGTGGIAQAFAKDLALLGDHTVTAVGSRTQESANAFVAQFPTATPYGSYEELVQADVDAIYVASPHPMHEEHTTLALLAGKPVLCEKAFTINEAQAERLVNLAREKNLALMEAMWTRYLPHYDVIRQVLEQGTLGDIELVNIAMCHANLEVARLFKKGHGDPFFDMGIYPVSFCQTFLGNPTSITAQGVLNADGIEEEVSVQLRYASGARAYILLSARAGIPGIGQIAGTKGNLDVGPEFFVPTSIGLREPGMNTPATTWVDESAVQGHEGLSYQATAMASYLDQGLLESPLESHADSLANLEVCAEVIRLIGAQIV
jgi:predicted dehydrogenase